MNYGPSTPSAPWFNRTYIDKESDVTPAYMATMYVKGGNLFIWRSSVDHTWMLVDTIKSDGRVLPYETTDRELNAFVTARLNVRASKPA